MSCFVMTPRRNWKFKNTLFQHGFLRVSGFTLSVAVMMMMVVVVVLQDEQGGAVIS